MPCWSEGRQGPENLRAYVGTRAQRSTTPRPRRPLPVPFVQPSPPGHPVPRGLHKEEDTSGLCSRTRRRLRQDSLLQKQKKKEKKKTKHHKTRNKTQQKKQSNTLRTEGRPGLRGGSRLTRPVAARALPAPAAGPRDPNVAQALPGAVPPPAACHPWRLLVAGPGGQMHLGFFAPFLILIFKLCFLSRWALAGAGKTGGGPGGSGTCPCPAPPRPGTGR